MDNNSSSCDEITSASLCAQVKSNSLLSVANYWVYIATIAVVIVLILIEWPTHPLNHNRSKPAVFNNEDYHQSLKINMDKLEVLSKKSMPQKTMVVNQYQAPPTLPSKAFLARQHAPSTVYEAPRHVEWNKNNLNQTLAKSKEKDFPQNISIIKANNIPHLDTTVVAGELISAILETGINSDLPGMVRATVRRSVYSYTGSSVVIPKGSRLIGNYMQLPSQVQNRIGIVWRYIILPDGITVLLNSPSTDLVGQIGQRADSVNYHFIEKFSQSVLLSILGAGISNMDTDSNQYYEPSNAYRTAIAQSLQQASQNQLQQQGRIKPTLSILPGTLINVFVANNLSFYQVYQDKKV